MPRVERRYRILERGLRLVSDRTELLDFFDGEYGAFRRSRRFLPKPDLLVRAALRATPPRLEIASFGSDPRIDRTLELPVARPRFVYELVQRAVFQALPDYLFLHAAVAVKDGAALAVSGASGSGKTTLLLSLVRRGFEVFSDEYAPIRIETGQVSPFPRALSLRIRPGVSAARRSVAVSSIGPSPGSRPVPLRQIAFLDSEPAGKASAGCSVVIRARATEDFLRGIRTVDARVSRIGASAYDSVVFTPAAMMKHRIRILEALNAHRNEILHVYRPNERRGVFGQAPDVRSLAPAESARLFMSHIIDNANPDLTAKPGAAFFRVCSLLKGRVGLMVRSGTPGRTAAALAAIWDSQAPTHRRGG